MSDISNNILNRVKQFLTDNNLLQAEHPLIFVGLSGGSDSVALIHILKTLGYANVVATHCNFQLRGEESERDQAFCENLCRQMRIKLYKRRFSTFDYMERKHLSLEMACRELRYNWWAELINTFVSDTPHDQRFIAVGHHLDDSIETVLMNLMRGTGINGLTGIVPLNQATKVVRPLLCLTRNDIISYVDDNGLGYVTDSTNRENDCQRNSIRNRLLPLMEEINPNTRRGIINTMAHLQEIRDIAYQHIDEKLEEHVMTEDRSGWMIRHLMTRDMDVNRSDFPTLVREFILSQGIRLHPNTLAEVVQSARFGERKIYQGEGYWICNSEDDLLAEAKPLDFSNEIHEIHGTDIVPGCNSTDMYNVFVTTPDKLDSLHVDATMTLIDADKVHLPLIIRHWQEGDRILPFGRKKTKLVSDFMTDAHFSWWQKATNWLVTDSDGTILWVYGLRSSDVARIDSQTKKVIAIVGPEF